MSDMQEYLDIFLKALKVPSPSGMEEEFSNFLLNFLENQGFINVRKDEIGNVIGEIGSGKPVLLLSSHMDTINDWIEPRVEGEKIYARGAVDAKGPLMALVIAASKFCKRKINGKIIFAGIVKEETSLIGINTFLNSGIKVDYAIFAEPSNTTNIVVGYKGRLLLKIVFNSKKGSGHVASSWLFKNSIEHAYSFYLMIKELFDSKYKGARPFFSVIPNITGFKSNEIANVIPSTAEIMIDIRFPPGINSSELMDEIEKIKRNFIEQNEFSVKIEKLSQVEGYSISHKLKIVEILSKSIEQVLGIKSRITRKTGTTFMNIIGHQLGIPTISIGPGDPKLEHTSNEYILKQDFLNGIKIIEKFIENLFGLKD